MDRGRYRALLTALAVGGVCAVCVAGAPRAGAEPTPTPSLTPSVQATPPPKPTAVPPGDMPGAPGNRVGRIKAAMMESRQREEMELGSAGGGGGGNAAARLARMTPEEQEAFKRNLQVWRELPPEERQDIRKQANERNREEIIAALRESGLRLDNDQKEMFALRYLQERRRLERQIQEQAATERARRLPEMLERLKHEFESRKAGPPVPPPPKVPGN